MKSKGRDGIVLLSKALKNTFPGLDRPPPFLFAFALLITTSCNSPRGGQSNACRCETKNVISKETAILIAKGCASLDYEFKYLDKIVLDEGDNWKVTFDFKPEYHHLNGGAPTAIIAKSNGDIISYGGTK